MASDRRRFLALSRRHKELEPIVRCLRSLRSARSDLAAAREMLEDAPAAERELAREELVGAETRVGELEEELRTLLLPRDPNAGRNVIVSVRGAEGGEEANLFARDLFQMYQRYAERRGWKTEILDETVTGLGGVKDATVVVKGRGADGAWSRLKFEGGVHRVQRVPVTESQGRIHTSAAGVLVVPEADQVEVQVNDNDLKVDVFRSSGPGGQSVNTTDSAVRITHLPTGIVVSCQNERSQIQNRASAMAVLQAKLLERRRQEEAEQMQALRGDGGRAWGTQIRNYVLYPYQNVKDVRTGMETGNAVAVLDGEIDEFIDAEIRWLRQNGR